MQLIAGDVEVGQVGVLVLDLHVTQGEVLVLLLGASDPVQDLPLLLLQLGHPFGEPAKLGGVPRAVGRLSLFQFQQPKAQPLVLLQEILSELGPLLEDLHELLAPVALIVLLHAHPGVLDVLSSTFANPLSPRGPARRRALPRRRERVGERGDV